MIMKSDIEKVVRIFYDLCFEDVIIGHFFFRKDKQHLIQQQTDFTYQMLTGEKTYYGPGLAQAHKPLNLRPPHIRRRTLLLKQALEANPIPTEIGEQWLAKEKSMERLLLHST